jgi:hypothetical protein
LGKPAHLEQGIFFDRLPRGPQFVGQVYQTPAKLLVGGALFDELLEQPEPIASAPLVQRQPVKHYLQVVRAVGIIGMSELHDFDVKPE